MSSEMFGLGPFQFSVCSIFFLLHPVKKIRCCFHPITYWKRNIKCLDKLWKIAKLSKLWFLLSRKDCWSTSQLFMDKANNLFYPESIIELDMFSRREGITRATPMRRPSPGISAVESLLWKYILQERRTINVFLTVKIII